MVSEAFSVLDPQLLLLKVVVGLWVALVLAGLSGRKALLVFELLVSVGLVVCAGVGGVSCSGSIRLAAFAATGIAVVCVLLKTRTWLKPMTPGVPQPTAAFGRPIELLLAMVGFVLSLGVAVGVSGTVGETVDIAPAAQLVACCVFWGLAFLMACVLTFNASPATLLEGASNISRLSRIAAVVGLVMLVVETAAAWSVFFGEGPRGAIDGRLLKAEFQLLGWMFSATVLVVMFTVWMVPYRLWRFGKRVKSQEFVSLTLAVWLGVLAMTVALAMPVAWPWTIHQLGP